MRKLLTTALLALLPARALAQSRLDAVGTALNDAARTGSTADLPQQTFRALALFVNDTVFFWLIRGAIALTILFMMYGSFQYFTAYGDENRATSAKKTVTYAFIGLLVAFMAMGISAVVQQSVTNNLILQGNTTTVQ